jgi:uncharacterized protein YfaS (alpha-2-macroglobulin family)
LELARRVSQLNVYLHRHVCHVGEPAPLLCEGLLRDNEIVVSVYASDLTRYMVMGKADLGAWVADVERRFPEGVAASEHCKLISSAKTSVAGRDTEGVFQQRVPVPLPGAGLYLVTVSADGIRRMQWVLVTDLGLIVKQDGDRLLAYSTHILTGQPIAGVRLAAYREQKAFVTRPIRTEGLAQSGWPPPPPPEATVYREQAPVATGLTGTDGLTQLRLPPAPNGETHDGELLVLAEQGKSLAAVHCSTEPAEANDFQFYMCTDRPVYRPGDMVHFKGIVRRASGDRYLTPVNEPVALDIRDELETLLYHQTLRTNDYGSVQGDLRLPSTASPGSYQITAAIRGEPHEAEFEVAAYRKPQFKVAVKSAQERLVSGDDVDMVVSAEYYFGTPVAKASVEYRVYREPYWFDFTDEVEESVDEGAETDEEDDSVHGEVVASGRTRTDKQGVTHVRLATRFKDKDDPDADSDYRVRVVATVKGPGGQEVEAEGQCLVTRGDFRLDVIPSRWMAKPGETVHVVTRAADYDRHPQADLPIEVVLQRRQQVDAESQTTVVTRTAGRTDAQGKATVDITAPAEGHYSLVVSARDGHGNRVAAHDTLWVSPVSYAEFDYQYPELEIVTDKRAYEVGDTIHALVNSKVVGAMALVSVEGQGLRRWFLKPLRGKSTLVDVPALEEYAPNVYLTVGFVQNEEYVFRTKRIEVSPRPKMLTVELRTDKNEYHPGESAVCQVTTRDSRGNPTPAELSLGVVDEAVYAIREDNPDDLLQTFYARRPNHVQTHFSSPTLTLGPRVKGAGTVAIRKRFPDTALWRPDLRTDARGQASVRFSIPDTLTTWRLTARGCTTQTLVGSAVRKVLCKKDFMARLEMPRFLVQGDRAALTGVVHNQSGERQATRVTFNAGGCAVTRAPRLDFSLLPERVRQLEWRVLAETLGPQVVRLTAETGGGPSDGLEQPLPILPQAREHVESRAGVLDKAGGETFTIRTDAVPELNGARLLLAPSVTAPIWSALDYLADYPWGCVEQTMSSFLPDVVIARALKQAGLARPQLQAKLPDMVQTGLLKLYGFQRSDGGWGWWRYDEADPWMTAYVLFGLLESQDAGFPINTDVRDKGLTRLKDMGDKSRLDNHDLAFAAYVLARAGSPATARKWLGRLEAVASQLSAESLALMCLTYHQIGDLPHAEQTYIRLWSKSRTPGSLCSWPGDDRPTDHSAADTEATALALKASLAVRPNDPRLGNVVRWLMARREGTHWTSTRDTAFVLYATADYVRVSQELKPDFSLQVSLNGKPLGSAMRFSPGDVFAPERTLEIPASLLQSGENTLWLARRGTGNVCYSLQITQYVPDQSTADTITSSGLRVEHTYHLLSLQRDPKSGVLEMQPDPHPRTRFHAGDLVRVKASLSTRAELGYVMLEDPLPAGCEVVTRGDLDLDEWVNWYSDMTVRDDRVAFFARRLPPGQHEIEYDLRFEAPGVYHVRPATVSCMYQPTIATSGESATLEVR